ncbi:MAG: porphobilinogen deaminase [Bacteroidetes bacterium]|nr:MAG: porphobilinogen deaminase [Bacteroidota bacterium]
MNGKRKIIIASRGSELALWQAHFVQQDLARTGLDSEIKIIKTQGDKVQHLSLDKLEGKGFFTKEIEEALLNREADLAVHSHKDLPTESPEGLLIAAVSYREDPSELILVRKESFDPKMKFGFRKNAVIGTSSARRKSLLLAFRSDIEIKDLRGNVPTRIQKLRDGEYDAILLAAAGVERLKLDLSDFHVEKPDPREFVPAPAQGVLALQTRADDAELINALQAIHHADVAACISIERKVLNLFEGGCHLPLGCYCIRDDEDYFQVWATKADAWDKAPRLVYMKTKRTEDAAERIVEKIKNIKPASVFITRNLRRHDFFADVLRGNGYKVEGRALIEINAVPLIKVPAADWVFFSSKHAVRFFLQQAAVPEGARIAAVGKGTAQELREHGLRADFIGQDNDTRLTGKKFGALAGRSTVLFPQAKGSMRTIQQQLPAVKVINLIVYESIQHSADDLPVSDILVFTSPSNAESWLEKNKIGADQKVVAMGHATESTLKERGVRVHAMPATFDDAGLAAAVFGC